MASEHDQPRVASGDGVQRDGVTADRRRFLRAAGLGGVALALPGVLAACAKDAVAPAALGLSSSTDARDNATVVLDFSSDIGVLNCAYALEQLEAAFYTMVIATPYAGMSASEKQLLTDVRDHELVHRDFFAAALGSARIPDLTPNFGAIDFQSRSSVLRTARTFEDLGVGAYNGAATYIKSERYLIIAGKIVSVEARHASAIRDLLEPRTRHFAPEAFDGAFSPTAVLAAAGPFVTDSISAINT